MTTRADMSQLRAAVAEVLDDDPMASVFTAIDRARVIVDRWTDNVTNDDTDND